MMMRPGSSQSSMYRIPSYMRAPTGLATTRVRSATIPQEFLVRDLKEKRKFRLLSRKLTVFVTFVTIYVAVLLLDRNISGRSVVRRIISNELLATSRAPSGITFTGINSIGSFWDWFANSFVETVYATTNSDGSVRAEDELYTIASHTKIVGGFHLLQHRYGAVNASAEDTKGDQCYSTLLPAQGQACFSSRTSSDEPFGVSNGTNASEALLASLEMFQYSSNDSASGYQTFFLRSATDGAQERERVALMRSFRWIDRQTRLVEITMPLYNQNLKLWSVAHLTVVFDLAGGVTPESFIHVTNLEPYDFSNNRNVLRGVLEIVFVAHVVYFFLLELWDICVLSNGSITVYMARYGVMNNLGDWGNIVINAAICLWRFFCQTNPTRRRLLAIESFDEYVPALSLVLWDDVLLAMNIFNVLLLTARTLKYFQVTAGGRRLMYSVYGAMPEVSSFLPIYCSVIIGYTFAGHMLYGLSFPEWSTFPGALFRVFELNFGLYDPGAIYDAGGYLSAIFIYSSNVVFCILMLNVFMAIVMSTWEQLSEKEAEKAKERASFSHPLGLADMVHLILMKEDVVDALIDVAMDLEGQDSVTLSAFTKEWRATGMEVSPRTWERVVRWYWEAATAATIHGSSDSDKGKVKALPLSSLAATEGLGETDDTVKVIKTARDLSMDTDADGGSPVKPKRLSGGASGMAGLFWNKPPSAKVVADQSSSPAGSQI